MQKSILPFTFASSGATSPSRFIAIFSDAPDGEQFLGITPRVMQWDSNTYLLDLKPVQQYWSHLSDQQGLSLSEHLSSILNEITGGNGHITLASTPWQALLLLSVAEDRPTLNFVDAQTHTGLRLFHDITWTLWINRCRELREHMILSSGKKSGSDNLGSLNTLTKTIARMQFSHIAQMRDIDPLSMQKRFGKLAATAWEWTWSQSDSGLPVTSQRKSLFHDEDQNEESLVRSAKPFMDQFPWQSLRPKETPQISRLIENHLRLWDHIEPLLRDDLDKLCNLTCWSPNERVVSLEWELSFSCSPSLRIPVLFRHPHALHRESGHHKTALLQAFHSWQRAMQLKSKPDAAGHSYLADDDITDWTITIQERMILAPQVRSLFRDDLASELSQLRSLENSLPIPLIAYGTTDHWSPEKSFDNETHSPKTVPFENIAKLALNQRRPLFIFDTPQDLKNRHQSSGLIFCERVGTSWWSNSANNTSNPCRDYYIRMTDDGLLQWVYQTDDGVIKLHGIYG